MPVKNKWKGKLRKQSNSQFLKKKKTHLGINLTKDVKNLYLENYKTGEEIKQDTSK